MAQLASATKISPEVRPFVATDIHRVVNRDGTQQDEALTVQEANAGPAFTAWIGTAPIGCAGVVLAWPGVGMAWMTIADEMAGHGLWLTRIVRAFLRDIIRTHRLHRLEAVALADSLRNQRWLMVLGFGAEGGIVRLYLSDRRAVQRFELIEGMDRWPK